MSQDEKDIEITEEIINQIRLLIQDKDEINLEWLKTVTRLPAAVVSKIIIQCVPFYRYAVSLRRTNIEPPLEQ